MALVGSVVGAEVGVVGEARVRTVILGAGAAVRLICLTRSRRHSSIKALVRSVDRKRGSAKLTSLASIVVAQHFKRIKKYTSFDIDPVFLVLSQAYTSRLPKHAKVYNENMHGRFSYLYLVVQLYTWNHRQDGEKEKGRRKH